MGVLKPSTLMRLTAWPLVLLLAGGLLAYHLWMVGVETVHPLTNALDAHGGSVLVLPVVAAGATVVAGRLVEGEVFRRRLAPLKELALWAVAVLPVASVGAVVLLGGAWVQMLRAGHLAGIAGWLAAAMVLSPLAAASWGALAGRTLPLYVALPTSIVVAYLALGAFASMENGPARLMMAPPVACCVSQTEPTAGASTAYLLTVAAMVLLLAAAWWALQRPVVSTALLLAALLTALAGWQAARTSPVHGLRLRPAVAGCQAVASGGLDRAVELCLWPENEDRRAEIAGEVERLAAVAGENGISFPRRFTEYPDSQGRLLPLDAADHQSWARTLLFSVAEAPRCGPDQVLPEGDGQATAASAPPDAAPSASASDVDAAAVEWWEKALGERPDLSPRARAILGESPAAQLKTLREHSEQSC